MSATARLALPVLEAHICSLLGRRPEELERVLSACEIIQCREGDALLQAGQPVNQLWFIADGMVMVSTAAGQSAYPVFDFQMESEWVTDLKAFMHEQVAFCDIVCLSDTLLCAFSREKFQNLMQEMPPFAEGFQKVVTAKYFDLQERTIMLSSLNAGERIQWLVREKPLWYRRVKDKWLADLLGMSRETFSRLKP